jgi:hypothetical protein
MAKERSYSEWLESEFGGLIDELHVDQQRKRFLKSRWLDQVIWTEAKAHQARNRYYLLRLTTIVGALLVPALVSLNPSDETLDDAVRIATWVVSLVVAASAAIEQFFHFGDRWRNYRRTSERLKAEGWLYLQLSGPYASNSSTHEIAYSAFAIRVEELLQADVDAYLTEVTVEKEKKETKKQRDEASPSG